MLTPQKGVSRSINDSSWGFLREFNDLSPEQVSHVTLAPSLEMVFFRCSAKNPLKRVFPLFQSPLIFSFQLAGVGKACFEFSSLSSRKIVCRPGTVVTSFTPEATCRAETPAPQNMCFLNIYLSPAQLGKMLDQDLSLLPRDLRKLVEHPSPGAYLTVNRMSLKARTVIDEICNYPVSDGLRRLYLKGKAMELIACQLQEALPKRERPKTVKLSFQDKRRIEEARRILLSDFRNPPNLEGLARLVGINTTKLKTGFRQAYGATAFELFRQARLEEASRLLLEGEMSITEIAHALGYSDTSHFIKSFSAHYGATPGKYSKNREQILKSPAVAGKLQTY